MSREIKFRAWDGKQMNYWGFIEKGAFTSPPASSNQRGMFQMKQMQYTGLKDKNGVEIYEGDIVAWETGKEPGVQDCKMAVEFYFGQLGTVQTIPAINNTSEVIGNIYENPELVK